jgi:hypothetical protein
MRRGLITSMTSAGLAADLSVDAVITRDDTSQTDRSGAGDQPTPKRTGGTASHGPGMAGRAGITA